MKHFTLFCFLIVISLFAQGQGEKQVTCSFNSNEFSIERTHHKLNGEDVFFIQSQNFSSARVMNVGEPDLAAKTIRIHVPLNARMVDFVAKTGGKELVREHLLLEPVQPMITTNQDTSDIQYIQPSDKRYTSSEIFPRQNVNYIGEEIYRGYKMFVFSVCHFQYNTNNKELSFFPVIDLKIQYSLDRQSTTKTVENDDESYLQFVKRLCKNKNDLHARRSDTKLGTKYLIITNKTLEPAFQQLALWKNKKGVTAEVITVEDINTRYNDATLQLKIKRCIYDRFMSDKIVYVVLCGDDGVVPAQKVYGAVIGEGTNEVDPTMPSDYFYACFDGAFDWNANGNTVVGELDDNVDLAPEVFLSRISVNTPQQAKIYIEKLIKYETNPRMDKFAERLLITGNPLTDEAIHDETTRSAVLVEKYIDNNWTSENKTIDWLTTGRSCFGKQESTMAADYQNLTNVLNSGYGVVHMATHGLQNLWAMKGLNFNSDMASNLQNNAQGVIVTIACLTNAFDVQSIKDLNNETCLSEAFIRNPKGGAIAYFGCSREGWGDGNPYGISGSFKVDAEFFKNLYNPNITQGAYRFGVLSQLAKTVLAKAGQGNNTDRWLAFGLNPMGDPDIDIYTDKPLRFFPTVSAIRIPVGSNTAIKIQSGVSNATVCLYKDKEVFLSATTDAVGQAELVVAPAEAGTLFVTVQKHNYVTFQDSIAVIKIMEAPVANFERDLQRACVNQKVSFKTTSSGNPIEFKWKFEGGTPGISTDENPVVFYSKEGRYQVKLTVRNNLGENTSVVDNYMIVEAQKKPEARFISLNNVIYVGDSIAFVDKSLNDPTSWEWKFDGANIETAQVQNPVVCYKQPGVYNVSIRVKNQAGEDYLLADSYITVKQLSYCIPVNSYLPENALAIQSLTFADMYSVSKLGENGYQSFMDKRANVYPNEEYILSIVPQNKWPKNCISAWIDWNADGDWADDGELVWAMNYQKIYTTKVAIPANVEPGFKGMRVRIGYDDPTTNSCNPGSKHGEVEDYLVFVQSNEPSIRMERIILNQSNIEMVEGAKYLLAATILPLHSPDTRTLWSSSNSSIVEVDNYGFITAKHEGDAVVSVKSFNKELSAACKITVTTTLDVPNAESNHILVSPNPATDFICVAGLVGQGQINIYNVLGAKVSTHNFSNTESVQMYVGNLPEGVYMITYPRQTDSRTLVVSKFVKK